MVNFTRPMLAATLLPPSVSHNDDVVYSAMTKLKYPVLASLKMDGIRAVKTGSLVSRTLKLIPNDSIRDRALKIPPGFDMELWNPNLPYNTLESIIMSDEHEDSNKVQFHVLDYFTVKEGYHQRCKELSQLMCVHTWTDTIFKFPFLCASADDLFEFERYAINDSGEGICFRLVNSPYKQGRSTLREQYLVKHARFTRTEVTIIGFEEQLLNSNMTKRNGVGMMDRSSHKHKMLGKETLGCFLVRGMCGIEFKVGTGVGLTDMLREKIWLEQDTYLGKQIVIKHKPHGQKIKPRSPIFIGFREDGF